MIGYELFIRLYGEALESVSLDSYIAERGWQDWMEPFTAEQVAKILELVYNYANRGMQESREKYYSRAEFSRCYHIPLRTVENWEFEKTNAEYAKILVMYTFFVKEWLDGIKDKN